MKILIKLFICFLALNTIQAFSQSEGGGSRVGGGGDGLELEVESIRSDLYTWISTGGSRWIQFPTEMTQMFYEIKMIEVLNDKNVKIEFITDNIVVDGSKKTCQNMITGDQKKIICNIQRFSNLSFDDKYRLIHHEFASLVGVENNLGSISDYRFSKQVDLKKFNKCGLFGTIDERIKDCEFKGSIDRKQTNVEVYGWSKVSEYSDGLRIYLQERTQKLWAFYVGPRLVSYTNAQNNCRMLANRKGLSVFSSWELPSEYELFSGIAQGIGEINEDITVNSFIWINDLRSKMSNLNFGFYIDNHFPVVTGYFTQSKTIDFVGINVCIAD